MTRKRFPILIAALALSGCATTRPDAYNGLAADGVATTLALAGGAVEVGGLGLWGFPVRFAALQYADTLPEHEAVGIRHSVDAASWSGAAVSGLTVLGSAVPLAAAAGVAMWAYQWGKGTDERAYSDICAEWIAQSPAHTCAPFVAPVYAPRPAVMASALQRVSE